MAFGPSTIAGCKLWLQGNLGLYDAVTDGSAVETTGNPVKRWEDQSGEGMHFTEDTNPPIRQDAGAGGAVSLRFNGSNQLLSRAHADAAALNTLQTGSYTFVWLISATSLANEIEAFFGKYTWADARQFYCLYGTGAAPNRVTAVRRYRIMGGWQVTEGITGRLAVNTPYVLSYTFSMTAANTGTETWRLNGTVIASRTGAVPAVETTYPWQVGAGKAPGGLMFWFPGDVALAIAYDTALSDANLALAEDFARTYGNMAAFESWETGCRVVLDGDSLTFGTGSTEGLSYPAQLHTLLGRDLAFQNTGIASSVLSATTPSYDVLNSALTTTAIMVVWYGSNNINGGTSGADTYTLLQTYCTTARTAGYDKIIVLTMLPRTFAEDHAAKEAQRLLFNQAIRDGFTAETLDCDAVADVGADVDIGQPDSPGNEFYAEATHLNNAGYAIVAGYVQTAITPFLPDITAPTLSSATINAAGTTLTLVFDEAISNAGTGADGFAITPSGSAATLTYASGEGTATLVYTISRTIGSHETATLDYTPGTLADAAANALAAISGGAVVNNSTQDIVAPTLSSATVNAAGTTLTLVFDEAIQNAGTGADGFTVSASNGAATLTYNSGEGTDTLVYSFSRSIRQGEVILLDYTPGTLADLASNALLLIADEVCTNNSTVTPATGTLDEATIAAIADAVWAELIGGVAASTILSTRSSQEDVTAIKAKTDNLPASPAAVGSAMTLTAAYDAAKTAATQTSVNAVISALSTLTTNVAAVAAAVWAYASRTLTQSAAQVAAILAGSKLTLTRGDTITINFTGLGSLVGNTNIYFTMKLDKSQADSAAQVKVARDGGLVRVAGAAAGTGDTGSITVTDSSAGNCSVVLSSVASSKLALFDKGYYDVRVQWGSASPYTVLTKTTGKWEVVSEVTTTIG